MNVTRWYVHKNGFWKSHIHEGVEVYKASDVQVLAQTLIPYLNYVVMTTDSDIARGLLTTLQEIE